ncbi:hypothetical protein [Leptolyngbya sp. NIES-2104]|uniref:hypothetical protein n=1 Tax=Leptolyngbya sp. NIES-2104 TaxID=1552121 RepID=UPI0006ECCA8B|nr:hypothetical protein [Leptolyngbya sp. NIES-2104]GAP97585.1 hypothetical protein NIES2104_41320 [Leptolyngbya sp. NIES-2104]
MNTRYSRRFLLRLLTSASVVSALSCSSEGTSLPKLQGSSLAKPENASDPKRRVTRSSKFAVYDSLMYGEKPKIGLTPILVTGRGYWKGQDYSKPDEAACRQLAREAAEKYSKVVVNIEHWQLDVRRASTEKVQESMNKILQVIRWMRSERPQLQLGFYGSPPHRDYWGPIRGNAGVLRDWQRANDALKPIADAIDFLCPSLYAFYDDVPGWVKYASANIEEAQRFGKPVYPFLWTRYHVSNRLRKLQYIEGDYWKTQLETVRDSGAEGVVLWDWFGFDRSKPNAIDPRSDWWQATVKFKQSL